MFHLHLPCLYKSLQSIQFKIECCHGLGKSSSLRLDGTSFPLLALCRRTRQVVDGGARAKSNIFLVCIVLLTRPLIHSILKNEAPFSGQKFGKFICRNSVERSIRYWQDRSYLETYIVLRLLPFMWVDMLMLMMMMMMVLMKMQMASQFLS